METTQYVYKDGGAAQYTYETGNISIGNSNDITITTDGGDSVTWYCHVWYWDCWYPHYHTWYPYCVPEKSKLEQAFKIVQKLMEKKLINVVRVKDFVDVVNEIAEFL